MTYTERSYGCKARKRCRESVFCFGVLPVTLIIYQKFNKAATK